MGKVLFAWVGNTDLKAAEGNHEAGLGPIAQAAIARSYDNVVLLSDHATIQNKKYSAWLSSKVPVQIHIQTAKLSSPTNFGEIYQNALKAVSDYLVKHGKEDITFHLSPGTPAMAAVWIIMAKTRFPAELIESSMKGGVKTASVPFDISADYIPDLLKKPDEELMKLSQGLPPDAPEFEDIIHRCNTMKRLVLKARRVAPRNIPVLIMGESGTGKELLARAIHKASLFREGAFVAVNCGAIPSELVESELFGHEKGAFTGAISQHKGYLESASGGTLFLDEIGELPLQVQVKLLRALQEGVVVRVGSTKPIKVNARIITATNKNLLEEIVAGNFREDLFHRVAVAILNIPPLRERDGDIGLLVERLLEKVNNDVSGQPGYEHKKLSASAKNILVNYSWPGNIRELINTLQRAAIWSSGETIDVGDIEDALLKYPTHKQEDILGRKLGNGLNIQEIIDVVSRHYLTRAMEDAHGNKSQAAKLLGLPSYQTLTNWLKRYNLE